MNLAKLATLRDEHARLHADYKGVSERAREALREVAALRNYPASGSPQQSALAAELLAMPDLSTIPETAIKAAGIDRKLIERISVAQTRATALRQEVEKLAPALRRSGLLITRLNDYAQTA